MWMQGCVASSLMGVGSSSKPPGRGCAKGDAKRWHNGLCTPVVRDLAWMKLWLAIWAPPLTDVCSKWASWRASCSAEPGGTVSRLLRMLPAFTNTFIPTRAGTCHFLFLVVGSLESLTTNTGTLCNVCPNNSSSTKVTPLYGISSPFAAFNVTWIKGSRSACCKFSCTHLSVTVVISLQVSTKAFTSLPLMYTSAVGHHPVSPTMLISPVAWLLAMGTTSFPAGMKIMVLCLALGCKVLFHLGPDPGWCCAAGPAVVVCTVTKLYSHVESGLASCTSDRLAALVVGAVLGHIVAAMWSTVPLSTLSTLLSVLTAPSALDRLVMGLPELAWFTPLPHHLPASNEVLQRVPVGK